MNKTTKRNLIKGKGKRKTKNYKGDIKSFALYLLFNMLLKLLLTLYLLFNMLLKPLLNVSNLYINWSCLKATTIVNHKLWANLLLLFFCSWKSISHFFWQWFITPSTLKVLVFKIIRKSQARKFFLQSFRLQEICHSWFF